MSTARPTDGARAGTTDTRSRILDVAERLVQVSGFNGFSYADIAGELGVTKASLHYHFASKAELGEALVVRYSARFAAALEAIEGRGANSPAMLAGYAGLYADVLSRRRMCLCGMLAADYETLPAPVREAVIGFFDESETWLSRVLERGREEGSLRFDGPPGDAARMILGGLEGAMLVARPYGDVERFEAAATQLLAGVTDTAPQDAARSGSIRA